MAEEKVKFEEENLKLEETSEETLQETPETETTEAETTDESTEDFKKLSEEIENIDVRNIDDEKLNELAESLTKEKKVNYVEINDDYIKSQPKEIQKILRSIKGEILTEKALKNYVHAEQYIEKLKKQKNTQPQTTFKSEQPTQQTFEQPNVDNLENSDDVYQYVYNALKSKYDIPELYDKKLAITDYLEYLEESDPVKYTQFKKDLESTVDYVNKEAQRIKELAQNWEQIAMENIQSDIEEFKNKLEKMGVKPEDLNLNLEFDDSFYNEYIYKNILFDENNRVNKDVVEYVGNIPVIKKGKILEKLLSLNFDKILEHRKNSPSSTTSYKYPPAQSVGGGKFTAGKPTMINSLIDTPSSKLSDEDINQALEEVKRQLI